MRPVGGLRILPVIHRYRVVHPAGRGASGIHPAGPENRESYLKGGGGVRLSRSHASHRQDSDLDRCFRDFYDTHYLLT